MDLQDWVKEDTTNICHIAGQIVEAPVYEKSFLGTDFYKTKVAVKRPSGTVDILPVTFSKNFLYIAQSSDFVEIVGELRVYNYTDKQGVSHLAPSIYATKFKKGEFEVFDNIVYLTGHIVKKDDALHLKPLSKKIKANFILADNHFYIDADGKRRCGTNYIPCVGWGEKARLIVDKSEIGNQTLTVGTIESRTYNKALGMGKFESRTAYSVSCSDIRLYDKNRKLDFGAFVKMKQKYFKDLNQQNGTGSGKDDRDK